MIKPLCLGWSSTGDYRMVPVDRELVAAADAGSGYLFQHDDLAAALGGRLGAEWILVGRLHKPSFLFAYLMVHLVQVDSGRRMGDFIVEVKGQPEQATRRGAARLAEKIHRAIQPSAE